MEEIHLDDQTTDQTPQENSQERKRTCDQCGNEYHYLTPKSRFCSNKCRNDFNAARRKSLIGAAMNPRTAPDFTQGPSKPTGSSHLVASLKGIDPQSQYIIAHQHQIISDLKAEREKLRDKLEKVIEKRDELQKKVDHIELERQFKIAEKSGLNGVLENPAVMEIVKHAGPALGQWLMSLTEKQKEAAGVEQLTGSQDPDAQRQLKEIVGWFSTQPKEIQQPVYELLDAIAEKEPNHLPAVLKKLTISINTNGTVNKQHFN